MTEDKEAAVVLLHWGPDTEEDEIEEIKALLEVELYNMDDKEIAEKSPYIIPRRVVENDPQKLLDVMQEVFSSTNHRQVVYISAHGNTVGLCYSATSGAGISYNQLLHYLETVAGENQDLEIVFGSCVAMANATKIQKHLPACVANCWGFADKPEPQEVAALMAGVIADNLRLIGEISAANQCGAIGEFEGILDKFVSGATQWVAGKNERQVVHLSRNPDTQEWERKSILVSTKTPGDA